MTITSMSSLSPADLENKFVALGAQRDEAVALAVSGGPDSMALLRLAGDQPRRRYVALTVDHRLRPEAAEEAAFVKAVCRDFLIPHETLLWADGVKWNGRSTSAQAAARDARYQLMDEWCGSHGIRWLVTAHHKDDQAETVVQNLLRGSGVDGLSGMPDRRRLLNTTLVRPLLAARKADLIAMCERYQQEWIDDPSNVDPKYLRSRVRNGLSVLGASSDTIALTAKNMARARRALDHYSAQFASKSLAIDPFGGLIIDRPALFREPDETVFRVLTQSLAAAGGQRPAPRFYRLERLADLLARDNEGQQTLGGCVISWTFDRVEVRREPRHLPDETVFDDSAIWDNRCQWHGGLKMHSRVQQDWIVRGVAPGDWRDIVSNTSARLDPMFRPTVPALYDREGPIVVPSVGFKRPDCPADMVEFSWAPMAETLGFSPLGLMPHGVCLAAVPKAPMLD